MADGVGLAVMYGSRAVLRAVSAVLVVGARFAKFSCGARMLAGWKASG